jgi:hypothetical protein
VDDVETAPFQHPGLNTLTNGLEYLRIGLDHLARNPLVTEAGWLSAMIASAGFGQAAAGPALRAAVEEGSGGTAHVLWFPGDRLPPTEPGGYWSLTMYDEHSLLAANP